MGILMLCVFPLARTLTARLNIMTKYMEELKSRKTVTKQDLESLATKMQQELKEEEGKIESQIKTSPEDPISTAEKFARQSESSAQKAKNYAEIAQKGVWSASLFLCCLIPLLAAFSLSLSLLVDFLF